MFEFKPDYATTQQRMEAFWRFEVLDRPMILYTLPKEKQVPYPASHHASPAERWKDAQYQAELALAFHTNREYLGDALPITYPNLGPEVLSALYGCPLHFGDYGTSWTDPILHDWADADRLTLDWDHPYLNKLHELTDALLAAGKGKFITGMPDWHPGGDAVAAFRDPQQMAVDMIENVEAVVRLMNRVEADYFKIYDLFYEKLRAHGQPITSWLPLFSEGKYYIPSNDFSCMVSKKMYDRVFLPGIIRECQFLDRSIYHLDGPTALHHLESILAIPELNALQWVPGAGSESFTRWVPVYQRAQRAGKGVIVYLTVEDLELALQTLDPRGLCLDVTGIPDRETGAAIERRLAAWTTEKQAKNY